MPREERNRICRRAALLALLLLLIGWEQHKTNVHSDFNSNTTFSSTTNLLFCSADTKTQSTPENAAFQAFNEWAQRAVTQRLNETEIQEGGELAKARRIALAELIEKDPQRALEQALPFELRSAMPEAVAAQLEQQISARGNYYVSIADNIDPSVPPKIDHKAVFGDQSYRAFVYGKRLLQSTKLDIPMHGIVIGDAMAIHESPVRILSAAEIATLDPNKPFGNVNGKCPVTGEKATIRNVVDVGGTHYQLCCNVCSSTLANQLGSQLTGSNPKSGSSGGIAASITPATGTKTVLIIPAAFSDTAAIVNAGSTVQTLVNGAVNTFYTTESYGKTGMSVAFVTSTVTLPNTAAYYSTNVGLAINDGEAVAAALGGSNDPSKYDTYIVACPHVSGGVAGVAYIGSSGVALFGYYDQLAAGHELGHNLGCYHANYWNCTDGTIIGAGSNTEYGNPFSIMSIDDGVNPPIRHHDAYMKYAFGWLPSSNVTTVGTSGTYTIHAFDDSTLSGTNPYALKIHDAKNSNDYWVELRQQWTGNQWEMNGVELIWSPWSNSNGGTQLLNTTPGGAVTQSALVVGRTFPDFTNNIFITPIAHHGSTTGNQSMDVVVNLGPNTDAAPTVAPSADHTNVGVNSSVTLTANASDSAGNTLSYYWDFGDGTFSTDNQPTEVKSYSSVGSKTVKCTVSDMKGHTSSGTVTITVTSLVISTTSPLPGTDAQIAYTKTFAAGGGTAPYSNWTASGNVPPGLSMSTAGVLSGTPTTAGSYTFTVQVSDSAGTIANKSFTLSVNPAPSITTSSPLAGGDIGKPYSLTFAVSGGTAAFTWTETGPLPTGLSLSTAGILSGTPTATGTSSFTVKVTDSFYSSATLSCSLTINPLPTITTPSPLPDGNDGVNYSLTFATSGGSSPFTWAVSAGSLPAGLSLSSAGVISGKPTAVGTASFTVQATDAVGATATASYTLKTVNVPVLSSISVMPATATVLPGNTQTFTATGFDQYGIVLATQPAFTWSVDSGGTIDTTGVFTAGSSGGTFTVTAASGGLSGTASVIVDAPTLASPPTVNPTNIQVNVPVTFTASASDPSGATVTYNWNFGDGSTATGGNATHTFTSAGDFTVTLTITNSAGGSTTNTMNITVTPGAGAIGQTIPMSVAKLQGSVKFTSGGHDSSSISGVIPGLPKGFDPTGQVLVLNIDGASVSFTLDSKGRGKGANGSISLKLKPSLKDPKTKKLVFQGGNVTFAAKIQNGTWAATWGLDPKATSTNVSLSMPATIVLGGNTYVATVTTNYSDKAGVSGKFKK
jgi:PKD repeat protein